MDAILKGHAGTVESLLGLGVDIETKDKDGYTALSQAANKGQSETVEVFLNRGAENRCKN
jgi:ankyrin repeat protein